MPFKKGQGGRPKGVANKVTKATREAFQALLDRHWDNLDEALLEVRKEDPATYVKLVMEVGSHCVPKLKSIEHTGDGAAVTVQLIRPAKDEATPEAG